MSIKVMNYIWEHSEASGTELLCLLAIADNANDEGEAYPGIARLAKKCRVGERAIQKVLRKLESSGEITVKLGDGIKTKTGNTNRYIFTKYLEWVNAETPHKSDRGERGDTPGVNVGTPLGVNVGTPKPSVLTIIEPSVKSKRARVDDLIDALEPAPAPVNAFGTNLADERIIHEDPPTGPKTKTDFDPRQLNNGLWPKDTGQTAYEVYREVFSVRPSNYQIEHMTANATDLAKWREITQKCALKGFKSYDNVFDVYQNGFKPQKGQSRHDRRSNAPAEQSAPGHARPDLYAKYGWSTTPAT